MEEEFDLEKELDKAEYFNSRYDEALDYMEKNNISFERRK